MTSKQQRAMALANHLHLRARINEQVVDGSLIDYAQIRAWAPLLREAADLLHEYAHGDDPSVEGSSGT